MCDGSCGARAVTRRTFLAESTLAAVAAVLASACGDGVFGGAFGPGQVVALNINVNNFPALASVGGIARVDGNSGTPVAVYHSGVDAYEAFSMTCPHAGTTVNIQGGQIPLSQPRGHLRRQWGVDRRPEDQQPLPAHRGLRPRDRHPRHLGHDTRRWRRWGRRRRRRRLATSGPPDPAAARGHPARRAIPVPPCPARRSSS